MEREEPVHRLGRRGPQRTGRGRGATRRRTAALEPDSCPMSSSRRCCAARSGPANWRCTRPTGTGSRCRRSWRLNERHYGALQGKNKKQTLEEYGEEQFMLWRRSYDTPPPPLADDDEFSQAGDPRYAALPPELQAAHRVPGRRGAPDAAVLVRRDGAGPADRPDGAGGRARQLAARAGQAPRRDLRRGDRRAEHPDRHPAALRPGPVDDEADSPPVANTWTRTRPPRPRRRSPTRVADPASSGRCRPCEAVHRMAASNGAGPARVAYASEAPPVTR